MNIKEVTKQIIFQILESQYTFDSSKILSSELNQIERVFSFGRSEIFLERSNLLNNFPQEKKEKIEKNYLANGPKIGIYLKDF